MSDQLLAKLSKHHESAIAGASERPAIPSHTPRYVDDMRLSSQVSPPERATKFGLRAPAPRLKYLEVRAALEVLSAPIALPMLLARRKGDGRQVIAIPGYLTDDKATWALRRFLTTMGYSAEPWGLGRNRGNPERDAQRLIKHLDTVRRPGEPITLIGWSLGGVIAREVARLRPEWIREVITLGTPVEGGPKYTVAGERFAQARKLDLDAFERHVHHVNTKGITCPLTVIYTRGDGIVSWRAAIDRYNPQARHIRVPGSHVGLAVNPVVWNAIISTLQRTPERQAA